MSDRREDRQARTIALITAGLNYKQAYEKLLNLIKLLDQQLTHQSDFEKYRIAVIQFLITASEQTPTAVQDSITLISEHNHFCRHARDNTRRASKMRRKRHPDITLKIPLAPSLPPLPDSAQPLPPIPLTPEIDAAYEAFKRGEQGDPGLEHVKPKSPMFDRDT